MGFTAWDTVVCLAAALLVYSISFWRKQSSLPEPPGPAGLPLIGNLFDIPANRAWRTYIEWSQKYGSDLVRMNLLGNKYIVVNTLGPAIELLEKRSSIYSDRLETTMLSDLCGMDWNSAFMPYGPRWNAQRRAFVSQFGAGSVRRFRTTFLASTRDFVRSLTQPKPDVMRELRYLSGRSIMRTAYGIDVLKENDPYVDTAEHALLALAATANAGSYIVDTFPILKYVPEWFPGAGFQKEAKAWAKSVNGMREEPWKAVKLRHAQGDLPDDCAAKGLMETLEEGTTSRYDEEAVQGALATSFVGGSDTTVSALGSFFLAMVLNPDIQEKARRAIDQVCSGRLPEYSDMSSIPYVDALVRESVRWNPVIPLNIPRRVTTDDVYSGYFIPKGTMVVANIWAILHDHNLYPDPLTFNPDRFMKNGKLNPDVQDPMVACFGFGRRLCSGRFWAYDVMWMAVATTLATVTISPPKRADGSPVLLTGEYREGFLCHPKPFDCEIEPRSSEHLALLEADGAESFA